MTVDHPPFEGSINRWESKGGPKRSPVKRPGSTRMVVVHPSELDSAPKRDALKQDAIRLTMPIVSTLPEPFLVLDDTLRRLAAGRYFYEVCGEDAPAIERRNW